jgi:hypothetical protein
MKKFQVRADFRKETAHQIEFARSHRDSYESLSERNFEILANDPDDAKLRVREILKGEGFSEKSLERITWTVSKFDQQPRNKS